jgi:hypothetical protein
MAKAFEIPTGNQKRPDDRPSPDHAELSRLSPDCLAWPPDPVTWTDDKNMGQASVRCKHANFAHQPAWRHPPPENGIAKASQQV